MNDTMEELRREIIELSLSSGAVVLSPDRPFRWASGYLMPVYNDNRILLSFPRGRELVMEGFLHTMERRDIRYDGIAGTASAGIAPATLLADRLKTRFYYVRPRPKDHGSEKVVEGSNRASLQGHRLVLVEDLISTGGSSAAAAAELIRIGATVTACLAVFSYGFSAAGERFAALPSPPPVYPLVTIGDLVHHAGEEGLLPPRDVAALRSWMIDPFSWESRHDGDENHV
jgi:orotate phosphoribosyltransferase